MLVSIIIPIYNVSQYLRDCLDSCRNQTYRNIEVICVDDGSTDSSGYIADEYERIDSRFKVVHKQNGGLPSARRAGLEVASGNYIFHLDGDDNIPEYAIESLMKTACENGNPDIVVGDYWLIQTGLEPKYVVSRLNCSISGREFVDFILTQGVFNIWGKMYSRSLYYQNDIRIPLEISMGEDLVAVTQLAYYSSKVAVCHKAVYNYYVRPTSMSLAEKHMVGQLTDRAIYAVLFIARFLMKSDYNCSRLLQNYVRRFVYEYLRSPYGINMRKNELKELCDLYRNDAKISRVKTFSDAVVFIACHNLHIAKSIAYLRNRFH